LASATSSSVRRSCRASGHQSAIHRSFGDLIVRRFGLERIADLDILGYCVHTLDSASSRNGCNLFGIAVDVTGKADDVFVDRDANVLAIESGVEFEFVDDVLTKL
jgi:hypothetical protein